MKRFQLFLLSFFILMCFPLVSFSGNVDTFGIGAKATALGGAYSAYADGPFAVYYNPAGLTQIKKPMVSAGLEIMNPSLKVYDYKAKDGSMKHKEVQPYNKTLTDTSPSLLIPSAGFAIPLNDKFTFGFATYVPYGLHIKWDSNNLNNAGAYNSFESYYMRVVATPTIAYKISDKLSVGFGISIGRSYSGSQRRIYAPGTPLNNKIIKGTFMDAVNYSYNIGIMYKPIKKITLGLTYRSKTSTNFSGTVKVIGVQSVGATTSIDHPDQIQGGIRFTPTDKISLEADVLWTRWDLVDQYTLHFNTPLLGKTKETFDRNWKNTTQYKFGAEWKASKLLTLRAGYYYDPSPIPTETFDLLWPDGNKSTYCGGLGLNFGKISVDLAAQYIVATSKRHIRGDSKELNGSYADPLTGQPGSVSAKTCGHLWGYALTVNYMF